MKKILIFLLIIFVQIAKAQPDYLWVKTMGGESFDFVNCVNADANGNVYIGGKSLSDTLIFGTDSSITYSGGKPFLAKYDSLGNEIWMRVGVVTGCSAEVSSIAVDSDNNVYITGSFCSQTLVFDTTVLHSNVYQDIFLVKYDPSGNLIWAKSFGDFGYDIPNAISIDQSGNIYMTGYFNSEVISFGSTTLTSPDFTNEAFLAKFDENGNVIWAKKAGGTDEDEANSVTVDAQGNIYITGFFDSPTIQFGATTLTNQNIAAGNSDIFLVKYNASGNVVWAKSEGGNSVDEGQFVKVDSNGNIYLSGTYGNSSMTIGSTVLSCLGYCDIFLVKYDPSGNPLWAKHSGGNDYDVSRGLVIDSNNDIYLTAFFNSSVYTNDLFTFNNIGNSDMLLSKYDLMGNNLWAASIGGTGYDNARSICADALGNIYFAGYFNSNPLSFGAISVTSIQQDVFLNKIASAVSSISELNNQAEPIFSPNPFTSETTLRTVNLMHSARLIVYNSLGQEVRQINNITGNSIVIQRDDLPAGLYFVQLKKENSLIATEKLVISDY